MHNLIASFMISIMITRSEDSYGFYGPYVVLIKFFIQFDLHPSLGDLPVWATWPPSARPRETVRDPSFTHDAPTAMGEKCPKKLSSPLSHERQ